MYNYFMYRKCLKYVHIILQKGICGKVMEIFLSTYISKLATAHGKDFIKMPEMCTGTYWFEITFLKCKWYSIVLRSMRWNFLFIFFISPTFSLTICVQLYQRGNIAPQLLITQDPFVFLLSHNSKFHLQAHCLI